MHATILICDNNQGTHHDLQPFLKEAHLNYMSAYSGKEALEIIEHSHIDFLILDDILPDMSGKDVIKEIRKTSELPILYLSTRNSESDRIVPLELGADDLVIKPFSPMEVVLRIQNILRRQIKRKPREEIFFSNLKIDITSYKAYVNNVAIDLTHKEFQLLALLASNPGRVLSRNVILQSNWKDASFINANVLNNHIKRLRSKIPSFANFKITSVYGVGYKIEKK